MPAKPSRKGIFEGSHGVMLPSALPALDVTTAAESGTSVKSTMMKLLRCTQFKNLSRTQNEYAMAKAANASSGIHVRPEVSTLRAVTSGSRASACCSNIASACCGSVGKPISFFFSAS